MVYLLVAFSGVPFFYRARIEVMIIALLFPAFIFMHRRRKIDKFIIYYIFVVILIQVGQTLKFYQYPISTYIGLHIRVLFAYLTIRAVGQRIMISYIHVIVFSVISSLIFYIPSYFNGFESFLRINIAPWFVHPFLKSSSYQYTDNVLFYTINPIGEGLVKLLRNSGPFWEPGAFAGFLIVALLFNIIRTGKIAGKINLVLFLGMISAFSTSGLIAMAFVWISYYLVQQSRLKRIVLVPLFLCGIVYLFVSVEFLGDKIIRKLSFTDKTYNTRFKSAQIDLYDFSQSPLVGLGRSEQTRFGGETDKRKIHRNNGVTNFLATYGAVIFLLYFILIYRGFKSLCWSYEFNRLFSLFALGAILLIGFSEVFFTRVFFIALTMLPAIYSRNYNDFNVEEEEE